MTPASVAAAVGAALAISLAAGPAGAQTRPSWVDPPARPPTAAETKSLEIKPLETKAPEAVLPEARSLEVKPPEAVTTVEKPAEAKSAGEPPAGGGIAAASETPRRRSPESQTRRAVTARAPQWPTFAASPTAAPPVIAAAGPSDPRFSAWAAQAQRLMADHLDGVSAPGDGIAAIAPRLYAERVRFHGRTLSLAALIAEKRRFARRWPERRYEARRGSQRVACSAATATCVLRATFDFRADNPSRGARSQGVGELAIEISFAGERPVIVSESSRVVGRVGPVSALARPQRGA